MREEMEMIMEVELVSDREINYDEARLLMNQTES